MYGDRPGMEMETKQFDSLAWPDRYFLQGVYRLQYKRP